jgi:hypothetical protein
MSNIGSETRFVSGPTLMRYAKPIHRRLLSRTVVS